MPSKPEDVYEAEVRGSSVAELRDRAQLGAAYWIEASRHERDEASGVWMARYIRAIAWQTIDNAPKDGTDVLLTDGENVWIGSQRIGEYASPSRGGQPVNGHLFAWPYDKPPTHWTRCPVPPASMK